MKTFLPATFDKLARVSETEIHPQTCIGILNLCIVEFKSYEVLLSFKSLKEIQYTQKLDTGESVTVTDLVVSNRQGDKCTVQRTEQYQTHSRVFRYKVLTPFRQKSWPGISKTVTELTVTEFQSGPLFYYQELNAVGQAHGYSWEIEFDYGWKHYNESRITEGYSINGVTHAVLRIPYHGVQYYDNLLLTHYHKHVVGDHWKYDVLKTKKLMHVKEFSPNCLPEDVKLIFKETTCNRDYYDDIHCGQILLSMIDSDDKFFDGITDYSMFAIVDKDSYNAQYREIVRDDGSVDVTHNNRKIANVSSDVCDSRIFKQLDNGEYSVDLRRNYYTGDWKVVIDVTYTEKRNNCNFRKPGKLLTLTVKDISIKRRFSNNSRTLGFSSMQPHKSFAPLDIFPDAAGVTLLKALSEFDCSPLHIDEMTISALFMKYSNIMPQDF